MAFQPPSNNTQRELTNRKIIEDLQQKKQLLLKQGVVSTLNASALPVLGGQPPQQQQQQQQLHQQQQQQQQLLQSPIINTNTTTIPLQPQHTQGGVFGGGNEYSSINSNISNIQRSALQIANSQSTGFFITQDSSFGNFILPVLPRFDSSTTSSSNNNNNINK